MTWLDTIRYDGFRIWRLNFVMDEKATRPICEFGGIKRYSKAKAAIGSPLRRHYEIAKFAFFFAKNLPSSLRWVYNKPSMEKVNFN